jgi:hypothetical protein
MVDFYIEPDQVKKIASDISSIGTSLDEMKTYTAQSQLSQAHFGRIPGLSASAAAYVAKAQEMGESLTKAAAFVKDYATRLNQSATLNQETEQENAWGMTNTANGLKS